jgi:hypothetical protein
MDTSYNRYLSYTQRELQLHLDRQRDTMPDDLRADIMRQVGEERTRLRSVKAKERAMSAAWGEIERPLKAELRIVVNMGRYKSKTYHVPERSTAIAEYRKILEKLCKIIDKYKRGEHTPLQLAKIKSVPNQGAHWVDWIPDTVKRTVTGLFDAIPHHFKAKTKVPFERRTIDDKRDVLIRRLARTVKEELGRAYKDLANDPDEYDNQDHHAYIARMELAQQAIVALPDDAYVPATWQGLFKTGYAYPITPEGEQQNDTTTNATHTTQASNQPE